MRTRALASRPFLYASLILKIRLLERMQIG